MRISIVVLLLVSLNSIAGDSLTCKKPNRFFVEFGGGQGGYLFGEYFGYVSDINNDQSDHLSQGRYYNFSRLNNLKFYIGYKLSNRPFKNNSRSGHYLCVFAGLNYFNHKVTKFFDNSYVGNGSYTQNSIYQKNRIDYSINKLNYSVYLSLSTHFNRGFMIRNQIGFSYSSYLLKKTFTNAANVSGYTTRTSSLYVTPSNPWGYYKDYYSDDITFYEKNYLRDKLNV